MQCFLNAANRGLGWISLAGALFLLGCSRPPPPDGPPAALTLDPPIPVDAPNQSGINPPTSHAHVPARIPSANPPPAPCGLPNTLLARGWPRELSPTSPTRPDAPPTSFGVPPHSGTASPHTAFTVGVIPDTQYYTLCRHAHFAAQVQWLADEATTLKLLAALHLGDITESNTPDEWLFARSALAPLRDRRPTFLATGNHDYGDDGTANRRHTLFAQYFSSPPAPTQSAVAETMTAGDLENAYYRLTVVDRRSLGDANTPFTLGVLVVEWSPREKTVDWANRVLTKYPDDRVVFVTHAYLYHDSTRYDWARKGTQQEWNPHAYGDTRPADKQPADVFDGEKLWRALVSKHKNVFLTLNGHVLGDGTGLLSSRGAHGNVVHQVLVNYQMLNEGGLGYLRLMEFDEDGKTLRMRTYSPSLGIWATAPDQHFDLTIEPPLW